MALEFNEKTKVVNFSEEYLDELDAGARTQAEQATKLINRLMSDLVQVNGEFPPPSTTISKNVSSSAAKLVTSGVKALQAKKYAEAVKLLQTALETVLRRPLWESTQLMFEEVAVVLGPLCDANIALRNWPEVYAQASVLVMVKSADGANHFRRGAALASAGRTAEARDEFVTALTSDPTSKVFAAALQSLN